MTYRSSLSLISVPSSLPRIDRYARLSPRAVFTAGMPVHRLYSLLRVYECTPMVLLSREISGTLAR